MFTRIVGLVGMVAVAAVVGCANDEGGGAGGSGSGTGTGSGNGSTSGTGNPTTTTGTGTSFECCLNGEHFTCPDAEALDACFQLGDPFDCEPTPGDCGGSTSGGSTSGGSTSGGSTSGGSMSTGSGGDDLGQQCQVNSDCMYDACLVADGVDFGYCSKNCMDFTDCPTFWSCEEVGNATGLYCVQ